MCKSTYQSPLKRLSKQLAKHRAQQGAIYVLAAWASSLMPALAWAGGGAGGGGVKAVSVPAPTLLLPICAGLLILCAIIKSIIDERAAKRSLQHIKTSTAAQYAQPKIGPQ